MELCLLLHHQPTRNEEKKRKYYAFWHQFHEKPSIIPGCPVPEMNGVQINSSWTDRLVKIPYAKLANQRLCIAYFLLREPQ